MSYNNLPFQPTLKIEPFTLNIPDKDIDALKTLLKLSRLPKETYENIDAEKKGFGVSRKWLDETRKYWLDGYDWRKHEKRINAQPAYTTKIQNKDGLEYTVHFAALFSNKKDAIPIILTHGWPGCFIEFLGIMERVREQYSADDLPYHLIFPSQPGYLFTSDPPLDREFSLRDVGYLFHELMQGLGFKEYVAQGGDIGSFVSTELAYRYESCKAVHLNMYKLFDPPEGTPEAKQRSGPLTAAEMVEKLQPYGYSLEHATRPSTVGLVVGSNPASLLCWIGEKFLTWSDEDPSLDTILTFISLYWFTDTYPSSIWNYRYSLGSKRDVPSAEDEYQHKPMGFSYFPREISPVPVHWIKQVNNLVWSKEHTSGGHFAALEKPQELWQDIEEFVAATWNKA
ncbi:hypothetical protein I317_01705 [Kwoniella heveanensis CBS 569]|nr:hypothetical protein I317_01705 [Kwoniella heveanensis CBS 569]